MEASPRVERVVFAVAVLAVGLLVAALMLPVSGFAGMLLHSVLDPRMAADHLASFSLGFLPFLALGVPGLIVAARFAIRTEKLWLVVLLVAHAFLWSTLGFAGFWVGAMGI